MKLGRVIAGTIVGLCWASSLCAAVGADQAARLGRDLTPVGAEKAGNADGSIPAWDGSGPPVPAGWQPGGEYPDPYPEDRPVFVVTGDTLPRHAAIVPEGMQVLLKRYGDEGFRLDVYQTRRNAAQPQWYYDGTLQNATGARLVEGGQKIEGNVAGVPFPIPQSGLELLWNHMVRFQGYQAYYRYDSYYVDANGKAVLSTTADNYVDFPMYIDRYKKRNYHATEMRYVYLRVNYLAPPRRAGEILLVHEPGADYTAGRGRDAWQYLTGQRRVRKAPSVSFDTPNPATAGTSTYDDSYMYNGSPERYDWKLVGKKEMLIPYNCNTFVFGKKVEDMLGKHFFKPEFVRWEKHRVWIVEGTLKPGSRHLYSKRRYYVDEDTWAALVGELWDGEGELWRVQLMYPFMAWDIPAPVHTAYGAYDLVAGIYNINTKPVPGTFRQGHEQSEQYMSPQGIARTGVR